MEQSEKERHSDSDDG